MASLVSSFVKEQGVALFPLLNARGMYAVLAKYPKLFETTPEHETIGNHLKCR